MGHIHIHIEADSPHEFQYFVRALAAGTIGDAPAYERPFKPEPKPEVKQAPEPVDTESAEGTSASPEVTAVPPEPAKPAEEKRKPGRPKTKLKEELEASLDEAKAKVEEMEAKTNGAEPAAAEPEVEEPKPQPAPKPAEKLTRESIAGAMNNYIGAFGSAAAVTDFKVMCSELFGVDKLSQIPDDADNFAKMIGVVDAAIASNRFGRKAI